MKVLIVIPSRYGSTRFEGKPLVDIAGKSLVRRTWEQAQKTSLDARVVVATDDFRIYDHVSVFGECVMTSGLHLSGTDRCFEAAELCIGDYDIVINLQGDEPFIQPSQIEALARAFEDPEVEIATLRKPLKTSEELFNPNIVSVVCAADGSALYFSREAIPHIRGVDQRDWVNQFNYYRHVGVYAFRHNAIDRIKALKPGLLEQAESLEQLRWLENGFKIHVGITDFISPAIDSREDLIAVDNFLKMNPDLV